MLQIKNLSVSYDHKIAVDSLSAEFNSGQIIGLIGPNGAGKSTLLKTCIGLISAYTGDIFFGETNLIKNRFWVKQNASYAAENAELLPYLTGQEFLTLIARIHKLPEVNTIVDFFINLMGLEEKKGELTVNYSHGMKQKLSAAAALLSKPKYLFLDESLNGMDAPSLYRIFDYLQTQAAKGCLIIISSHNVDLIRDWCQQVFIINKGKIISNFDVGEMNRLKQEKEKFLKKYIALINS